MDTLIIQTSSCSSTTSTTVTPSYISSDIHHNTAIGPYIIHCRSTEAQLLDNVTKSLVNVDAWIAQELDRISHNCSPRNCLDYESLLSVIEGLYQMDQYTSAVLLAKQQQYEKKEEEDVLDDDDDDESEEEENLVDLEEDNYDFDDKIHDSLVPTTIDDNNPHHAHIFTEETFFCNNRITTTPTVSSNDQQLTQRNLVFAFYKLIHYCQSESPQFYLHQQRKTLELLITLENISEATHKQQLGDIQSCQKRLAHILFFSGTAIGHVPPIKLTEAWNMIRLWVQQNINTLPSIQQKKWVIFGMSSYQIAKQLCGINNTQQVG